MNHREERVLYYLITHGFFRALVVGSDPISIDTVIPVSCNLRIGFLYVFVGIAMAQICVEGRNRVALSYTVANDDMMLGWVF